MTYDTYHRWDVYHSDGQDISSQRSLSLACGKRGNIGDHMETSLNITETLSMR